MTSAGACRKQKVESHFVFLPLCPLTEFLSQHLETGFLFHVSLAFLRTSLPPVLRECEHIGISWTYFFPVCSFSRAWEPAEGLWDAHNFLITIICFLGHSELENHFVVHGQPREWGGVTSGRSGVVRWKGHRGQDCVDSIFPWIKGGRKTPPCVPSHLLNSWTFTMRWHLCGLIPFYWLSCGSETSVKITVPWYSPHYLLEVEFWELLNGEHHFERETTL